MIPCPQRLAAICIWAAMLTPIIAQSTDVDGPNDCTRNYLDWGDAPEATDAYPGVLAKFPTCSFPGPVGTMEVACMPPRSTPPGPTGAVIHTSDPALVTPFWLGCPPTGVPPMGVDSEGNGKTNSDGAAMSFCDPSVAVDCFETAFTLTFGQDECYGSDDACLDTPPTFGTCEDTAFEFESYYCGAAPIVCRLNVLVDWNGDGDWNDNFLCPDGECAYEWAVKNEPVLIPAGCGLLTTPTFRTGPFSGSGWMRITISEVSVIDNFPWEGTLGMGGPIRNGETEDYPVEIQDPCPTYRDWGDAPETAEAYAGVPGHFPTCLFPSGPGTQELGCPIPPRSTPPLTTGFVCHARDAGDLIGFWLGCAVDAESDGKMNATGGPTSFCDDTVPIDCVETALGMDFGQDECYGDADAALATPKVFDTCAIDSLEFLAYNCKEAPVQLVYLNILVDWNRDGDWNDNFPCPLGCAHEWAVKNWTFTIFPGCNTYKSPEFITGPFPGEGWMRVTVSPEPAPDDYPWAGTAMLPTPEFGGGETEDYPVRIGGDPCSEEYHDFGDAPEEADAYPGIIGKFPTCVLATPPGTMTIDCDLPDGTPPGPVGFVQHTTMIGDPTRFWLGCAPGIDTENNGKTNSVGGAVSTCDPGIPVDCVEAAFGLAFGQDECFGDGDAGLDAASVSLPACSLATVEFRAYNCLTEDQPAWLNIAVDWNGDGDWSDNVLCTAVLYCAHEWAVKNFPITLTPGCNTYKAPEFRVGPVAGPAWLRITISEDPALDDYPWNGSAAMVGGAFKDGETEDYPVEIVPSLVDAPFPGGSGLLQLSPPIPNPTNESVTMRYLLPRDGEIALEIFDPSGRRLRVLEAGTRPAGEHVVSWDLRDGAGRAVPAGVYIVRLQAGEESASRLVVRTR